MNRTTVFKLIMISLLVLVAAMSMLFYGKSLLLVRRSVAVYYIYRGDMHYKEGRHQETLADNYNENTVQYQQALDTSSKEYQKALDDYNYALHLYPEHTDAQYNLGNIYYTRYEDYYSAMNCYEKALNVKPDYIKARINLGNVFIQELHDLDRAINEYSIATKSEGMPIKVPFDYNFLKNLQMNKAVAYYNLGVAYKSKSLLYSPNTAPAREYLLMASKAYKKSIDLDANDFAAHYNLGITYQLLREYPQAIREYCKAIKLAPNYEATLGAHYNLAVILKDTGKYNDAISELQKAGIILGAKGESDKVQQIYDLLNDTAQKASIEAAKEVENHKKVKVRDCDTKLCDFCSNYGNKDE